MGRNDVLLRRIAAALLDMLVLAVAFVLVAVLTGDATLGERQASARLQGGEALVFVVLVLVYFFAGEAASGQTPGKRVLRIRVVDAETGGHVPARRIAIRTLLRIIDNLPGLYLLGFLSILVTGQRRARIGDLAARTKVVAAS